MSGSSSSSAVEIDFFRLNSKSSLDPPAPKKLLDRRDIQEVISKINPELLKTAIASASAKRDSMAMAEDERQQAFSNLPVYNSNQFMTRASSDSDQRNSTAINSPMTIFYNGTVSVFDVPRHQAENIMKLVGGGNTRSLVKSTDIKPVLNQDFPLSRKKSLRRFLEKRKERQSSVGPYASPLDHAFSR